MKNKKNNFILLLGCIFYVAVFLILSLFAEPLSQPNQYFHSRISRSFKNLFFRKFVVTPPPDVLGDERTD